MPASRMLLPAALLLISAALPGQAQDSQTTEAPTGLFVAGVIPSERPAGAPEITQVRHDADWYAQALTGVSQPYPGSLKFLEDQGNWFTPFTHPGMHGRFDIRGWHSH